MKDYGGSKSLKGLFKILVGVFDSKQDKISGVKGQLLGFDSNGNPTAQDPPDTGVMTFNGRTGGVIPKSGDYTPSMVGALPITGGTLTGPLTITKVRISYNEEENSIDFEVV